MFELDNWKDIGGEWISTAGVLSRYTRTPSFEGDISRPIGQQLFNGLLQQLQGRESDLKVLPSRADLMLRLMLLRPFGLQRARKRHVVTFRRSVTYQYIPRTISTLIFPELRWRIDSVRINSVSIEYKYVLIFRRNVSWKWSELTVKGLESWN